MALLFCCIKKPKRAGTDRLRQVPLTLGEAEDLGAAGERQVGCLVWALALLVLGWSLALFVCTLVVVVCLACERAGGKHI